MNAPRGASQRHRSLESRLEIERLTSGLEGGCWKSAQPSKLAGSLPYVKHGFEAERRERFRRLGNESLFSRYKSELVSL